MILHIRCSYYHNFITWCCYFGVSLLYVEEGEGNPEKIGKGVFPANFLFSLTIWDWLERFISVASYGNESPIEVEKLPISQTVPTLTGLPSGGPYQRSWKARGLLYRRITVSDVISCPVVLYYIPKNKSHFIMLCSIFSWQKFATKI